MSPGDFAVVEHARQLRQWLGRYRVRGGERVTQLTRPLPGVGRGDAFEARGTQDRG
jgi:hypothetical protein